MIAVFPPFNARVLRKTCVYEKGYFKSFFVCEGLYIGFLLVHSRGYKAIIHTETLFEHSNLLLLCFCFERSSINYLSLK